MPLDTDGDEVADFRDIDSDADGLLDENETGCPSSTHHLLSDSDADSYSDAAELAVGSDPCDLSSDVFDHVEFFFVLEPDNVRRAPLSFSTDLQQVDIHFSMDTTNSMGGEIANLQGNIRDEIIPEIGSDIPDAAFGISSYRDFPVSSFGAPTDHPFRLEQRVTLSTSDAQDGANRLVAGGGADGPESGWEALFQIATGLGEASWAAGEIPAFDPDVDSVEGVADGELGGVGFREGSLPIVVQITDATSHAPGDYGAWVDGGHSRGQAVHALNTLAARAIGFVSGGLSARNELVTLAQDTGALVPACAFDGACGLNQCCTGVNGSAQTPVEGVCPLVFTVSETGELLSDVGVDAISFLVHGISIEVTTRVIPDPVALAGGLDTSCFIRSVTPTSAVSPGTCAGEPEAVDLYDPVGDLDSFVGVTPGTEVFFDVVASNDGCVEQTLEPQAFDATIEVVGDGVTVLDSLRVTIIIPPLVVEGDK